MKEIINRAEEPLRWTINGLLLEGATNLTSGQPHAGKSLAWLAGAMQAASPTIPPRSKELDQQDAVNMICGEFGEEFLYENANGSLAIDRRVLAEFRKLTKDTVVREKSGYWRARTAHDPMGRRQVD